MTDANRDALAAALPAFELTLRHGDAVVDRGVGANVLDSPALALAHLARVLAEQPEMPPLRAGEIVTTGTVTDAWPVAPGRRGRATTARWASRSALRLRSAAIRYNRGFFRHAPSRAGDLREPPHARSCCRCASLACATPSDTAAAQKPVEEKEYRTGSRIPVRDLRRRDAA